MGVAKSYTLRDILRRNLSIQGTGGLVCIEDGGGGG